jgi:hypothetical protein
MEVPTEWSEMNWFFGQRSRVAASFFIPIPDSHDQQERFSIVLECRAAQTEYHSFF